MSRIWIRILFVKNIHEYIWIFEYIPIFENHQIPGYCYLPPYHPFTANANMNIICKEYSRIYSIIQIFATLEYSFRKLLFLLLQSLAVIFFNFFIYILHWCYYPHTLWGLVVFCMRNLCRERVVFLICCMLGSKLDMNICYNKLVRSQLHCTLTYHWPFKRGQLLVIRVSSVTKYKGLQNYPNDTQILTYVKKRLTFFRLLSHLNKLDFFLLNVNLT